jgi:hypothetical protein
MLWAILVCSILFTSYTLLSRSRATAIRPAATPAAAAAAPAPAADASANGAAAPAPDTPPLKQADFSEWRSRLGAVQRDPFFTVAELEAMSRPVTGPAPRAVPTAAQPAYTVKLVMMAGSERHALVDRQVVRVGDMLGNERVAEIVADAVVLERDGRRRRLPVATGGSSAVDIRQEPTQ